MNFLYLDNQYTDKYNKLDIGKLILLILCVLYIITFWIVLALKVGGIITGLSYVSVSSPLWIPLVLSMVLFFVDKYTNLR